MWNRPLAFTVGNAAVMMFDYGLLLNKKGWRLEEPQLEQWTYHQRVVRPSGVGRIVWTYDGSEVQLAIQGQTMDPSAIDPVAQDGRYIHVVLHRTVDYPTSEEAPTVALQCLRLLPFGRVRVHYRHFCSVLCWFFVFQCHSTRPTGCPVK